jgi:hypothetical protein
MKLKISILIFGLFFAFQAKSIYLLIPMDDAQKNHLKAYGITFWVLENNIEVKWLLNYRGGSFLMQHSPRIENECVVRGVTFESITDGQAAAILDGIAQPDVNQDALAMNKAPRIAVYSPPNN